jgi:predicted GNAT family acetyltransferase
VTTAAGNSEIIDIPTESRLVFEADGAVAELLYAVKGDRLYLLHTEVPDALSGRGLGGRLVRAALERAARDHLNVVPWCPFARKWLKDHPDATEGVAIDFTIPPPSQ